MMPVVFLALLGGWLLLSTLVQVPSLRWTIKWFAARDCFGLLPDWWLFAYTEASCLHLWYRDWLQDGQVTRWNEVAFCNSSLWRVFWNPRRRHWKMLVFACHSLADREEYDLQEKDLFILQPYLLILTAVLAQPRQNGSTFRQFMITRTHGLDPSQENERMFVSSRHPW